MTFICHSEQATIFDAFKRYGDFSGTFSIPGALNPFSYFKESIEKCQNRR